MYVQTSYLLCVGFFFNRMITGEIGENSSLTPVCQIHMKMDPNSLLQTENDSSKRNMAYDNK